MDVDGSAGNTITARAGMREFYPGVSSTTLGFSQDYLGPTLRFVKGRTAKIAVENGIDAPITAHWHGMHLPGQLDGGPQLAFGPGETWAPELPVDHPAATLWYHSHVHGETATQVYRGLAGLILLDDPEIDVPLPRTYGEDDIPLIVQDRLFRRGVMTYDLGHMDQMAGFQGSDILVNGALRPTLTVPAGLVRLRLLNASNARTYEFGFSDGRGFHQVASDGGLLPAPQQMTGLHLSPGERAEIVIDFSDRRAVRLISADIAGGMMGGGSMGGMMGDGGMMGGGSGAAGALDILSIEVSQQPARLSDPLPARLPATMPDLGAPVRTRDFTLNVHSGGMMGSMLNNLVGREGQTMGINGSSYDKGRIDFHVPLGETERWRINADMMAHPFHVHGASFLVTGMGGQAVDPQATGLKDVVHVDGPTEFLVRFEKPATDEAPFMYHCHILEHEDRGMMGQFTVG
ncbi:MAG: copper oxidase [Pelagibaca sp.]|nr:copper oxidase [Pelagibaca sp.]